MMIVQKESPLGLYKGTQIRVSWTTLANTRSTGLGAVATGIVPKMAIRFASFEKYKEWLTPANAKISGPGIFLGMPLR